MKKAWVLIALLFGVTFCDTHQGKVIAQVIPTVAPTTVIVATTAPTSYPTTAPSPTTSPIYITPGLPTVVPGTPPPVHVMTADYYPTANMISNCSTQMAPFITYSYTTTNLTPCGVKTIIYMSPSMPQKNLQEYIMMGPTGTYASAEAKDCSGNVVTVYNGTGYLMDPHASQALSYYQAVVDYYTNKYPYAAALFSDNSDEDYGASAQPCDWSGFADWTSATVGVLSKLNTHGVQLFLNDLSLPEAYEYPAADDTVQNVINSTLPTTVSGGEQEGFIYDLEPNNISRWSWEVNTEIQEVAANRIYWAYANHNLATVNPASSVGIQDRMFLYASFLLGYAPNLSIYQTWFNTPSGMRVMPETGIVPTQPVETANSDVKELQNSLGLATRHFNSCYYRAVPLGPCAVVVNPVGSNMPVSEPGYSHSVTLSGSDILDGGMVGFKGPQITSLLPYSGAILLP